MLNDVASHVLAYVGNATVTAANVLVAAVEQAVIRASADSTASSSGGSSFTGQGTSLAATRRRDDEPDAQLGEGVRREQQPHRGRRCRDRREQRL